MDENGIPLPPASLQLYDSYATDPPFARAFTYTWVSAATVCILIASPRLLRSLKRGTFWSAWRGVGEYYNGTREYDAVVALEKETDRRRTSGPHGAVTWQTPLRGWFASLVTWSLYSPPRLRLDIGQIIVLFGYLATLLVCILKDAQLRTNSNRAGFLTLAQIPFVFLFSTKNNILAALMGRGYEKLNFLHRWAGRGMFLSATVHGSLWIRSHLKLGVSFNQDKERHGLSAYAVLGTMLLISLRPVRSRLYQLFFITHIIGFVSFFVLISYHTPYASPWIYPPLAFYGFDLFIRLLRFRFKPATLLATNKQITYINIERCDFGWVAGQHIRLRVFLGSQVFESHPLSICNAPPEITTITSSRGNILLGARVVGDWTKAINDFALSSDEEEDRCCDDKVEGRNVMVLIDGPYGGISFDLGRYESVLLVAGGAGITFTMGVLDDLVGRIVRRGRRGGERTTKIEFAWCIKSFGSIRWFGSQLEEIAKAAARDSSLELHMRFFVTCLCDPEAVQDIPNSTIVMEKPSISNMLEEFVAEAKRGQGGVGVAASGPEGLVAEARNSVARLGTKAPRLGGIALHTEIFCL